MHPKAQIAKMQNPSAKDAPKDKLQKRKIQVRNRTPKAQIKPNQNLLLYR